MAAELVALEGRWMIGVEGEEVDAKDGVVVE